MNPYNMKKISLLVALVLTGCLAHSQKLFYKSIDRACNSAARKIVNKVGEKKEKFSVNIVILPTKNIDGEVTDAGIAISDHIATAINKDNKENITAFTRKELEKVEDIFQEGTVPPSTTKEEVKYYRGLLEKVKPDFIVKGEYMYDDARDVLVMKNFELISNWYEQETALDIFSIKNTEVENKPYGFDPVWRSAVVPGLGQVYKKQKGKGFAILTTEAVLIAGFFVADNISYNYFEKAKTHRDTDIRREYLQDSDNWESARNAIGAVAAGVYIYNIIDAIAARNAIKEKESKSKFALSFAKNTPGNPYSTDIVTLTIKLNQNP